MVYDRLPIDNSMCHARIIIITIITDEIMLVNFWFSFYEIT